jgi:hypothetical protein
MQGEFRNVVNNANSFDREHGFEPGLTIPTSSAPAIRSAIRDSQEVIAAVAADLQSAEENAREGLQLSPDTPGVAQVLGLAQLLRSGVAFAESQEIRRHLSTRRTELIALAADIRTARSNIDRFSGIDTGEIVASLETDLEEVKAAEEETAGRIEQLSLGLVDRKSRLDGVKKKLDDARQQMLDIEQQGFTAGNDASFNAYRDRYNQVAQALRELQVQEEQISEGGEVDGEHQPSIAELEWELSVERAKATGHAEARDAITEQITYVQKTGQAATGAQDVYARRRDELDAKLEGVMRELGTLMGEAVAKETEALSAAQAAATTFRTSANAYRKWKQDASQLQNEKDPNRTNERLKAIASDEFAERIPASAEGAAKLMIGEIHAQRIADITRHLEVLDRFVQMLPEKRLDTAKLDELLTTSRDEATRSLNEAITTYQRLASGPVNTSWAPQTTLACAYYLLSKVDAPNADAHLAAAADAISRAVAGREASPRTRDSVAFRDHLRRVAPNAAMPPAGGADDELSGQEP